MRGPLRFVIGLAGFVLFWELVARSRVVPTNLFPTIEQIATAFASLVGSGELLAAEFHTLLRAIEGLAIAIALALALGLASATWRPLGRALAPFVDICRTLPPPALVPLLIFAVGLNDGMFLAVIVFAALWPIYLAAIAGLSQAEPIQLATARSFGASSWWTLWRVQLPSALPAIFTGIRVGLGLSLMATIASEMIAGSNGVGFLLFDTAFSLRVPEMFATLFAAGLTGLILNALVLSLQWPTIGWHVASTALEAV
jgi:NitT/TauT family transport system permease protein